MNSNMLIAYYSWSGNTRNFATQINALVGGTLFEILPVEPYPSDYTACVNQAKKEIREGYKPTLQSNCDKIASCDVIFIGSPNWWSSIAPPVASFLSQHDWNGKIVVPFCTHGGGGLARLPKDIAALCIGAKVMDCLEIYGDDKNAAEKITAWLRAAGVAVR